MKRFFHRPAFLCGLLACCLLLSGCTGQAAVSTSPPTAVSSVPKEASSAVSSAPLADNYPTQVLTPMADGAVLYDTETAAIDASHAEDGYIMAKYSGTCPKVKLLVITPNGAQYQYHLTPGADFQAFPLTEGPGAYTLGVYENVTGDQYAPDIVQPITVEEIDQFGPYLYPSQYVDFTADSQVVKEAQLLSRGAVEDLEVLERVYTYVVENITYDTNKAATVQSGYVPDPDAILASGTGICFDYAAVMASMLRSLGIPTQLQVGYMDTLYHAWISTHIKGVGWVNGVIEFDGETWRLMDPTTAASQGEEATAEFLNTEGKYTTKYKY